ncbi:unnamed protein product [Closterium sp. NIES-53]
MARAIYSPDMLVGAFSTVRLHSCALQTHATPILPPPFTLPFSCMPVVGKWLLSIIGKEADVCTFFPSPSTPPLVVMGKVEGEGEVWHAHVVHSPHHGQGGGRGRALAQARDSADSGTRVLTTAHLVFPSYPSLPPFPPLYWQSWARWRARASFMGKVEGEGELWHGHVTALTVAPEYRRQQLAAKLMDILEEITHKTYDGYFVDLFVRTSNKAAIQMYRKFGYEVYRRVLMYYSGEEDAFDMRKSMPRDKEKKSMVPLDRPVSPQELLFD